MSIDYILRPVEAYLNSRTSLLMAKEDRAFTTDDLTDIIKYHALTIRRKKPSSWHPRELKQLVEVLHMSTEGILGLQLVADRLVNLPAPVRCRLLKDAQLNNHKIAFPPFLPFLPFTQYFYFY